MPVTIHLLPQAEKKAPDNPLNLELWPLYHQMRTYYALNSYDLVMNTYNTGAGKTQASLLYLFDLNRTGKNVLFIAPTNALLAQHTESIVSFVEHNRLDFKVKSLTAAEVRQLNQDQRSGEIVQRLIRNYLEFERTSSRRQPLILVVNPDIFYYALFFRYAAHDRRNVFERFLAAFDYLVVDEFHYYDSKQLANFLFAISLFDQFGYFDVRQRKICLLSATPNQSLQEYLDRTLPGRWTLVSPNNEPKESESLETVPSLAPLDLTIEASSIHDWVSREKEAIVTWIRQGEDGALISSSLGRVNLAYEALRAYIPENVLGRITGPEPEQKRKLATARRLILATPTVDIGYNFQKLGKTRQNVDFLICDAMFGDELLQRIGRAGRLLDKTDINYPSRAYALVSSDALNQLSSLDGQTLTREKFAGRIEECLALPPKQRLTGYIRSWSVVESFYPIFQMERAMPSELHVELEELYERVRSTFSPGDRRTYTGLRGFFFKYEKRRRWFSAAQRGSIPIDLETAHQMVDWLEWLDPGMGRFEPSSLIPQLEDLLSARKQRDDLCNFVRSQLAVTEALFSFRESFQGPRAVVFDPAHRLSSETVNEYDLFHLVSHYRLSPPLSRAQFLKHYGKTDIRGDFYFHLIDWRDRALSLQFTYSSQEEKADFDSRWCRSVVGIQGLHLLARDPGGDIIAGGLHPNIIQAIAGKPVVALIIPPDDSGIAFGRLRGTPLWARRLTVQFPNGTSDESYRIYTGKAALEAHSELHSHFLLKNRLRSEVIIV